MKNILYTLAALAIFAGIFLSLKVQDSKAPSAVPAVAVTPQHESLLKHLVSLQSEDGSWGDRNREIVTSSVTMLLLSEGHTPTSREYGKEIKEAVKYLKYAADEQIKNQQLLKSTPYILDGLSTFYGMVGDEFTEKRIKSLTELARKAKNTDHWVSANGDASLEFNFEIIKALRQSERITGNFHNYEDTFKYFNKKYDDVESQILLSSLDNILSTKLIKTAYLSPKEINIKTRNAYSRMLFTATKLSQGGDDWRDWNKLQKEYYDTRIAGFSLCESTENDIPKNLKMSQEERDIFVSSVLARSIQVYYRYLPSNKGSMPIQENVGYGVTLTTVEVENVEIYDAAIEDTNDEAPSTSDSSVASAVSDVVVSPSAFASPSVFGGRSSAGRASAMLKSKMATAESNKGERYLPVKKSSWHDPLKTPYSTFASDVDRASYSNFRRFIERGTLPPVDSVRLEEFVNYFPYFKAEQPKNGEVFGVDFEMSACKWQPDDMLLKVTLSTEHKNKEEIADMNLVFLIDVSGSMNSQNKLGLVQKSMDLLLHLLDERDRVSIVTYAGSERVLLDSAKGNDRVKISSIIENLNSGGSTNGSGGINKAYELAKKNFIDGGVNRILLCTDGDFNVGITDHTSLMEMVEEKARSNVFLTVMGYGMGNYRDDFVEQLAAKGKGQALYIDDMIEVKKAFLNDFSATFDIHAKDVKLQVEFNPGKVQKYKLLGYTNRLMAAEDFKNDKKAGGAIGSGHQVTALYQLKLKDREDNKKSDLKYQTLIVNDSQEILTVKVRYKEPEGDKSTKVEYPFSGELKSEVSQDMQQAQYLAMLALKLRNSDELKDFSMEQISNMIQLMNVRDPFGEIKQLKELVSSAAILHKQTIASKTEEVAPQRNFDTEEGLDLVE